jgi:hypothetical protein
MRRFVLKYVQRADIVRLVFCRICFATIQAYEQQIPVYLKAPIVILCVVFSHGADQGHESRFRFALKDLQHN